MPVPIVGQKLFLTFQTGDLDKVKSQGAFFAILNIWYQWKAFIKFLDLPSFFNPCFNFNIT